MSRLKYETPDQLHVSDADKLNVGAFSASSAKCAENDASIFPKKRNAPGLWENRWFVDPRAPGLGYSKGEAVWINTEDPDEFVAAYENVIRGYAEASPAASSELDRLDKAGDRSALLSFYKQLVRGWNGLEPLFCIGDLSKPAQIRVSLVDDNRDPPTDGNVRTERNPSGTWKDFFDAATDDQLSGQILKCFREQADQRMALHMKDYHCSELSAPASFLAGRLQSDMGNLVTDHRFRSHYWYQPTLPDGFDYVLKQGSAAFQTGLRWFRLWNSGLLEHGGTLDTSQYDRFCSTADGVTRVRLDWVYSAGFAAPLYAYPTDALNALFMGTRALRPGGTPSQADAGTIEIQRSQMGAKYRFSAELTPWKGNVEPYSSPASRFDVSFPKELCYMSNEMFMFISNGEARKYSYHLRGFLRP